MGILFKCFGGCSSSSSTKQPSTSVEYLCHRFSLSQLRKSTNNFDESHFLGQGLYGPAYRGSISVNGEIKDIAVKRLGNKLANYSEGLTLYKNDVIFMCQLNHPNLLSLVGFCDDNNEMIVVYEYASKGSLRGQLRSKSSSLSWKKRLEINIGVARGLHYLHSGTKRIILHHHISLAAILLDENLVPKLSYFGYSIKGPKFSEKNAKPLKFESIKGSEGDIAPECFNGTTNVTYKCDVFSFGVLLLELICGKSMSQISHDEGRHIEGADFFPFTVSVVEKVRNVPTTGNGEGIIDKRLVGEIEVECWKLYMNIIECCLSEDPNERPDMGDVEVQLEHILQLQEEADANQAPHALLI
ncbi:hypothetical protein K1719_038475 [Acacia pycnantha]|nr:hypothetical protein K1719_038475 [Acacia pycnantha]